MFNRRCYGTTGERIILDFKVNGHPMGSETEQKTGNPVTIDTFIAGTSKIEKAEIIRNAEVIACFNGKSDFEQFQYLDKNVPIGSKNIYYYVRITQDDANMAWSSPVWITQT
jgi:hypothetical protein